jgi:hypothetical protein
MPYGIRSKLAAFALTQGVRKTLGITRGAGMICSHWLSQVFECPVLKVPRTMELGLLPKVLEATSPQDFREAVEPLNAESLSLKKKKRAGNFARRLYRATVRKKPASSQLRECVQQTSCNQSHALDCVACL